MKFINNIEIRLRKTELSESFPCLGVPLLNPRDVVGVTRELIGHKAQEHFIIFLLDARSKIIGYQEVAVGSIEYCAVDFRVLFRAAISVGATAIIAAHNHPTGDPSPSDQDVILSDRLISVGLLLGIAMLDHIVVSANSYKSLAELGLLL